MTIEAKMIEDSVANGIRLSTLELTYPRFIHSEFMTHRMFSRNASSSRAVPVKTVIENTRADMAFPIRWGRNIAGMQADEENKEMIHDPFEFAFYPPKYGWFLAADKALAYAEAFANANYHKQIVNRITEPYQHIKVIVTATEWENFFKLRLHPDAQPEIHELAKQMQAAMVASTPTPCNSDCWHLPYMKEEELLYHDIETVKMASVGRCARVSYLNHDQSVPSVSKDYDLAVRLLEAGHMSPFEHQAIPMTYEGEAAHGAEWGVTHTDKYGENWSSNFRGWLQHRQLL